MAFDAFIHNYYTPIRDLIRGSVNNAHYRRLMLKADAKVIDGISQAARNLLRNKALKIRAGPEQAYLASHKSVIEQLADSSLEREKKRALLISAGVRFIKRFMNPIIRYINANLAKP